MPSEQAAAAAASPTMNLFPLILVGFVFYFLVFRPEKEKRKKREELLAGLQKNDRIVTGGGIHATIVQVRPQTLIVRIADNVRIEIDKEAVATVEKREAS